MEKTMTVKEFHDKYGTTNGVSLHKYANMFLEERKANVFCALNGGMTYKIRHCNYEITTNNIQRNYRLNFCSLDYSVSCTFDHTETMTDAFECILNKLKLYHTTVTRDNSLSRLLKDYLNKKIVDMRTITIKDFFDKYYELDLDPDTFACVFLDERKADALCAICRDCIGFKKLNKNFIDIDINKTTDGLRFKYETPMSTVFEKILETFLYEKNSYLKKIIKDYLNN